MNKNILEEVKKFVEDETKKSKTYDENTFLFHLIPVLEYYNQLSNDSIDKEILNISALLHEIGRIIKGREDHHITGAEIAEKKLRELNYPEEKIEKIKHCIFSHRGSSNIKRETGEAKILTEADAIGHFNSVPALLLSGVIYYNQSWEDSIKITREKLKRSYNKLSEESKKLIKLKYDVVMLFFGDKNVN